MKEWKRCRCGEEMYIIEDISGLRYWYCKYCDNTELVKPTVKWPPLY